ncbi:LysM peptidoglycan-binding domain-containing protein [Desulfatirhabdium butyrativorans]|uniref:LysM peptidoglycan-binding domain-containing protein n=1 Tax=Desulfatirhabdium butyrativorans TaxID=340467 RepID=UPI0004868486|nr:LysM domain-containing protein [Desulfatirhabdium butyrativorans]
MMRKTIFRVLMVGWVCCSMTVWSGLGLCGQEAEVIQDETNVTYNVKAGDTLWEIAKRFYDSPLRWPDVWGLNPQIANPHRIYPGEPVHLYQQKTTETVYVEEPVPAPPPAPAPSGKKMPPKKVFTVFRGIDRVGFLRENPVEPIGRIVMPRMDAAATREMLSQGDVVYVQVARDDLEIGKRYRIYKLMGPYRFWADGRKISVYQHYINGIGVADRYDGNGIWEVRIEKSYAAIQTDDLLMPCQQRDDRIELVDASSDLSGTILFSQDHNEIFSAGFLAFMDKGELQGVRIGQRFSIVQEDRPAKHSVMVPYGECLVLDVESNTSSVWITKSDRNLTDQVMVRSLGAGGSF